MGATSIKNELFLTMSSAKKWLEQHYGQVVIVCLHVLAWVLYLAFYRLTYVRQSGSSYYQNWFLVSVLVTDLPIFYYFYARAVPRLLVGKKVWKFILVTLLIVGLYPLSRFGIDLIFIDKYPHDTTPMTNIAAGNFNVVFWIRTLAALFVIAMAGIGKFTFDWFENARIRRELENQNLTSELAFLKSQINPHFLFNTLNNIHTLAYKKSDGAPEAIMKLSELMRYMIYESDVEFVPLDKEVQHLKSFITLNELRFKTKDIVSLTTEGNLDSTMIAPLVLLPFIENAFKHGYLLNEKGAIRARLKVEDGIYFEVENRTVPLGMEVSKDSVGGIGLDNIKRRLDLIYPNRYTLDVEDTSQSFSIRLNILNGKG